MFFVWHIAHCRITCLFHSVVDQRKISLCILYVKFTLKRTMDTIATTCFPLTTLSMLYGCLDVLFQSDFCKLNSQNQIISCNKADFRIYCLDMVLLFGVVTIYILTGKLRLFKKSMGKMTIKDIFVRK